MKVLDEVEKFYEKTFGNNGFTLKDIPNSAPAIVAFVVDFVMLIAEYRVYSVGLALTHNPILALGFVAISSVPFYLGQLAFLYNQSNLIQKVVSVLMVLMGLGISGYFGFAELLIGTTVNAGIANINPVDPTTLYYIAIAGTIALILSGLVYGLVDDIIAQNIKAARIRAKANSARNEIKIKTELLKEMKGLRQLETGLKTDYSDDYDHLDKQFHKDKKDKLFDADDLEKSVGNQQKSQNRVLSSRPVSPQEASDILYKASKSANTGVGNGSDYDSQAKNTVENERKDVLPTQLPTVLQGKSDKKSSVFDEPQVRKFPSDEKKDDTENFT